MQEVKKTRSGKFSFKLSADQRANLYWSLAGFIESESVNIMSVTLKDGNSLLRHLYYSILNDLIIRQHSKFFMVQQRFLITRSEAIALLWFFRNDNPDFLPLKSALHKHLN